MSSAILAILSASCFALDRIFLRRGVIRISDPTVGLLITVPLSLPFFLIILAIMGRVHDIVSFPWQNYIWLLVAGLIHFVAGRMFLYKAIQFIGANFTAVVAGISPIIAATIGISILGEPLTWEVAMGIPLIVGGVAIVSVNPKASRSNHGSNKSVNITSRGILFALGSGIFFGISPVFVKMGLYESSSPVAATFISYSAAAIAVSAFLLVREKRTILFGMGNRVFLLFIITSLLTGIAQLLRYTALSISPISIVAPLIATMPVLLLGFTFLFNRKIEVFNRFLIIGVIITVIGAILLA